MAIRLRAARLRRDEVVEDRLVEDGWLRADGASVSGLHFIRVYSCLFVFIRADW